MPALFLIWLCRGFIEGHGAVLPEEWNDSFCNL